LYASGKREVKQWTQRKALRKLPYLYNGFWAAMGVFAITLLVWAITPVALVFSL
jgi:hypothetical protein